MTQSVVWKNGESGQYPETEDEHPALMTGKREESHRIIISDLPGFVLLWKIASS